MSDFGRRFVVDAPFDATLGAAVASFRAAGFSVSVMDVGRMVEEELRRDSRRYALLTAVSLDLLAHAIALDLDAGVAVPCDVAIYELADGRTAVAASEPMSELTYSLAWQRENPPLARVAAELGERVGHALSDISARLARRAAA